MQFICKNVAVLAKNYHRLWQSYKDDVEKYARNDTDRKIIRLIIETAPFEGDRTKFEGFGKSNYRGKVIQHLVFQEIISIHQDIRR